MLPSEQPSTAQSAAAKSKIGYVVKVYPRFSETFVVTEILAREAAGEELAIYALRPTSDARFHPQLAQVQAPVTHLPKPHKLSSHWEVMARAQEQLPDFGPRFGALMPLMLRLDLDDVSQAVDLALRLRADGITHVHVHFANVASWTTAIAAALTGLPYTVTTHAKDIFHADVDQVLLREVLGRAENVIAISEYNRQFILEQVDPSLAGSLTLVRNGLDLPRFSYTEPRDLASPTEPARPLQVLAVGRLVEKKGFAHLVRAAAALRDEGFALQVRIIGDGDQREALTALIAEHQVASIVQLVGVRSQAELVAELAAADVLAAPCVVGADGNADGLPTVILEAMASGVPCIATDVTGIPEAIYPAGVDETGAPRPATGILLSRDPATLDADLTEALRQVADPMWPRQDIASAARALIEREFDTRRQVQLLAALEAPREDEAEDAGVDLQEVSA